MIMELEASPATLIVAFNRPHLFERVLARTIESTSSRIYVAIDGPRESNESDNIACRKIGEIARRLVPFERLTILERRENLGCKRGVAEAITWFFGQESEGVILEDDILPDRSFFPFAAEMLQRYRYDQRVACIGASNHLDHWPLPRYDYLFSRFFTSWGWATWADSWADMDLEMSGFEWILSTDQAKMPFLDRYSLSVGLRARAGLDTWDYQWSFSMLTQHRLQVTPRVNLTENIGFGHQSTHTDIAPISRKKNTATPLQLPIQHPPEFIFPNPDFEIRLRRAKAIMRLQAKLRTLRQRIGEQIRKRSAK